MIMWNLFKNKKKQAIGSPVQGRLIDLSSVKDEAFASKAMGDGFAIEPSSDIFEIGRASCRERV